MTNLQTAPRSDARTTADDRPGFAALGLAPTLCRALDALDYETPTPIQSRAIPPVLEGRDILGIAQTGTGKTAAFALPILQQLGASEPRRGARALVLAPTRELAIQIADGFKAYGARTGLRLAVVFGGASPRGQIDQLRRGADVIIATPGRLLDLMNQGQVPLGAVRHLVLDEADRMLDMGFIRDVRKIIAAVPRARQSLLFSATMPAEVERLSREILNDPIRIDIAPKAVTVAAIQQSVHFIDAPAKPRLLYTLLADKAMARVIVFTRTKHRANRTAEALIKAGFSADAIHGNKAQGARQRALESFRTGKTRVLVATDIVARGIDVSNVTHVINFDIPVEPESYVHRIGRTARAGTEGIALSFCDGTEYGALCAIEALIGAPVATASGDRPARGARTAPRPKQASPAKRGYRGPQRRSGGARRAA